MWHSSRQVRKWDNQASKHTCRLENWQISFCKQVERVTTHHIASAQILILFKGKQKERKGKIACLTEDTLPRRSYINPQEKWSFVMKLPLETFISFTMWARKIIHHVTTWFISCQRKCCLPSWVTSSFIHIQAYKYNTQSHLDNWEVMCALFCNKTIW